MHTHWRYQGKSGWFNVGEQYGPYGEPFGDGDRITVTIDPASGALSFLKNGVSQGVAPFGDGDRITVTIDPASGALSFLKNGVSQGVAMNGFTQLNQVIYLRVYPANSLAAHPMHGGSSTMFGALHNW
eukprot:CAMPEP_0198232576 /NCGR_PEP_ID=MMETSP1445-20131203/115797_1 /TAXON_ID=36898 /ORGANISM="Pyramimonas sp., Strain CCMP2087" /LENGTH=127 /DNA_ID=CAMNT_0043913253 /DNA_START=1033 /DNA_END=1416 /DNA_ORIENTATION=-